MLSWVYLTIRGRAMRRKDREITEIEEILEVIGRCKVCRLAMAENNLPYVVPLNFGWDYEDGELSLYFHGAREGKKIDILKKNPEVCFEMDGAHRLIEGPEPASYSFAYESVIGFGRVEFLEGDEEKTYGLNRLMVHQAGKGDFVYPAPQLQTVEVYKLRARSFTGKRRPLPPMGD
jgi:nitroimidazol reductase NimA-like FMN-containing flavoprotein (pyridoxamine 5'-phosphate oxidase superfamily)